MPQITVTLSDACYAAVNQLPKGKKSRFVNQCVREIYFTHCWQRLELVEMFMNGHDGFIQAEKEKILTQEEEDILTQPESNEQWIKRQESEASGESGYE